MSNDIKNYFDNVDWHFDDAYNGYCKRFYNQDDKENNDYVEAGTRYAATHMGMYFTWIIRHNFQGDIHNKNSRKDLDEVRNEKMTGVEFLLKNCDGKLLNIDFNDEGLEFTKSYYEYYLEDYSDLVLCDFDIEYSIYEVEDNWNIFISISDMLDEAYNNFKEGKVGRVR